MLSSGIVRYFLELCEQAFNFAIMNGFGWEQPSPLSPEIQTKAARFVSRYKVEETSSFPLYGSNLRIFIQCLGQIFKELHRNERLTLGEPEPNHFTMDALDSLDHRDVLDCAITSKCSEDRAHYIYDCFKETATPIMSIDYDLATKIYSVFYTAGGITTTKRVQFSNVPRVLESMPAISFKNVHRIFSFWESYGCISNLKNRK